MKKYKDRYKSGQHAFSKADWKKFIAVVDNLEDEVLFTLIVTCGFRREDICHGNAKKYIDKKKVSVVTGIPIADINLGDNPSITYKECKKNRIRTIPITQANKVLILKLINSRGKQQSKWLIRYSGKTGYLKLQAYCEKAGVKRRPIHALRATCIKFCLAAEWSDPQISALTGDTIEVIREHYMTPSEDEMTEVTEMKPII
jgi:integrase